MPVLEVKNLKKTYKDVTAVYDISFSVEKGEIVGLLGPNGAGKTTTINMILGVLEPTAGSITIGAADLRAERTRALSKTNFAAVYAQLPGNLSVYENLRFYSLIYDVPHAHARIEDVLKRFSLLDFRNAPTGVLSSGEQTRVSLAKAFLNQPELLLLDEPTASLDPSTARVIRNEIKKYAEETSAGVLWTSHNMYEVSDVCDRVLFASRGKVLLEGDPKTLPHERQKTNLEEVFIEIANERLSDEEPTP